MLIVMGEQVSQSINVSHSNIGCRREKILRHYINIMVYIKRLRLQLFFIFVPSKLHSCRNIDFINNFINI